MWRAIIANSLKGHVTWKGSVMFPQYAVWFNNVIEWIVSTLPRRPILPVFFSRVFRIFDNMPIMDRIIIFTFHNFWILQIFLYVFFYFLTVACWEKQDSLCFSYFILVVQTFTDKTHYAMYTEANHPPSLHIPLLMFHLDSFFSRSAALQKRPVRGDFSSHYNLNLFNFNFNRYLFYISP